MNEVILPIPLFLNLLWNYLESCLSNLTILSEKIRMHKLCALLPKQSRATWPVKWYISTAVLPALPADSQSEMMLTSHYDLSYLVSDGK